MTKIKRIVLYISVFQLVAITVSAQQDPRMSQYMTFPMAYNPATVGMLDGLEATGVSRTQWAGLKDYNGIRISPQTFFAAVDAGLPMIGGGVSLLIFNETLTPITQTKVRLNYAYHLKMKKGGLNLGLMLGLTDQSLDQDILNPENGSEPFLNELLGDASSMNFDAGVGAYYHVPNKFYVGFSAMQLLGTKARYKTDNVVFQDAMYFNLFGGYIYALQYRPEWQLEPSVMMSLSKGVYQMDVDFLVRYNKMVWAGVGYRINDAVIAMFGFRIKDFKLGYSYDITTSGIGGGGSHEVSLKYYFKIDFNKSAKSYRNIRYL